MPNGSGAAAQDRLRIEYTSVWLLEAPKKLFLWIKKIASKKKSIEKSTKKVDRNYRRNIF